MRLFVSAKEVHVGFASEKRGLSVRVICLTLLLSIGGLAAKAQGTNYGTVSFLPGWTESSGTIIAAVRIELEPGWKTYWRVPGAAGIPPNFNWVGSKNLGAAEVLFPAPEVEIVAGLQSIGYHGDAVFPVRITPDHAGRPVDIALDFTFGVCREICIPAQAFFAVQLLPASPAANVRLIQSALDRAPVAAGSGGVISASCSIVPSDEDYVIRAEIALKSRSVGAPATIFEPGSSDLWADAATTWTEGNVLIAEAPLQFYGEGGWVLDRSAIRLTLIGEDYAVDIQGCPAG